MISIRKLNSLKPGTRQRKIISLLKDFEKECYSGLNPDKQYLFQISESAGLLSTLSEDEKERVTLLLNSFAANEMSSKRFCNTLRHLLLKNIHAEPAEWDLLSPGDLKPQTGKRIVFPFYLYLDDIRSPFNVGSIFRTAESFGVKKIFLSCDTASPEHPRAQRSAMGCISRVPWEIASFDTLPNVRFFALELGGTLLKDFNFPSPGLLIIGSEELGVHPYLLKLADEGSGRVCIPTGGIKASLNVSVAFGIVQQQWYSSYLGKGR